MIKEKLLKKEHSVIWLTILVVAILIIVGISYALWQLTLVQTDQNSITTGCFKMEFTDNNPITLSDAFPITDIEGEKLMPYEFTLTNICSKEVDYYINLETFAGDNILSEEYLKASLVTDNKDVFFDNLKEEYVNEEKVIREASRAFMLAGGTLIEGESRTFDLRLWLSEDTPLNDATMNKTYQGKITVLTNYVPDLIVRNMMKPMDIEVDSSNLPIKNNTYTQNDKYNLSMVSFESAITNYDNALEVVDFSLDGDKSVLGYYVKDDGQETYTLHIQANGRIQVNPNGYGYFSVPDNSTVVFEGIENVDTSHVEDMRYMFYKYNGQDLDLSGFNTRNVKNMLNLFRSSKNLTNLNLKRFNTSKVTNMAAMFYECSNLTTLDLSNFVTSVVTNMGNMFNGCSSLKTLDVSSFDTSTVNNMSRMFEGVSKLAELNLKNFDTAKVTNMSGMFFACKSLTTLDLSNFDTSNVTIMEYMFYLCESLTNLDISSFDTSKVADMSFMFSDCYNLTSLDISRFDTSKVTDISFMFRDCRKLTSLDLGNFDTSKVQRFWRMFQGCWNLTTTITIRTNYLKPDWNDMFENAAIAEPAKIIVNYTSETSELVDKMITTKSSNSNVIKGEIVS